MLLQTNTGAIDPIEIRPVLFELMGHEPSENEYRAFHAYCEPNELGVITFEEWMNGARKALGKKIVFQTVVECSGYNGNVTTVQRQTILRKRRKFLWKDANSHGRYVVVFLHTRIKITIHDKDT